MVRKKAAVCGQERCVTSLKTAAKETNYVSDRFRYYIYYHYVLIWKQIDFHCQKGNGGGICD